MRPVVFSASSVNAYLACHLQWYFGYVLNEPGEQSEAQAVGIAVHDAAEAILRSGWDKFDLFEAVDKAGPEVGNLIHVFNRDIMPTYREPVLIEAPFQIEVNGIPFSGIIDSLDYHQDISAFILRDLKTTGSRPSAGRYRFNMIGYWLGARDAAYQPDIMQLDYIVRTKTPYYWPEVVSAPDEDDLAWFAATLQSAADGVEQGDYEPTGLGTRACASCPYKAICGPYQRYQKIISPLRQEVTDA